MKKKPIILCAGENGRALVYGFVDSDPVPDKPVTLTDARMILYYPSACGGIFGVAASGPKEGARVTHAVAETASTVWCQWISVSDESMMRFADWPAYNG